MLLESQDIEAPAGARKGQRDLFADWREWLLSPENHCSQSSGTHDGGAPGDAPARAGRVLLISYYFPPTGGSGVQRPAKLAKYLPSLGWEVEVLTAAHDRFPWSDPSLLEDVEGCSRIHRVAGFEPACLARLAALPLDRVFAPARVRWLEDRLYWRFIRMTAAVGRGNGESLWMSSAVRAAQRLHARRPFDAVISTGPPHFVHEVALRLHRSTGLPWLADLRDPLVSDFERGAAASAALARNPFGLRLEHDILRHAVGVVTTCTALADDLRTRYPHRPPESIRAITNGFDRDDLRRALTDPSEYGASGDGKNRSRRPFSDCVFVAAGSLYGRREIGRLVEPLGRVLERHPEWRGRVRVVLAGSIDARQRRRFEQDRPEWLTLAGYLDHAAALRLAASAACNVIMVPDCRHGRLSIPGKIFELLALPTHVLALAPESGDTARILSETGAATVVPLEDADRVAAALERIIADHFAGRLVRHRDWPALERFDRRALAAEFAGCLGDIRGTRLRAKTIRRLMFVSDGGTFGGAEAYIVGMAGAARRRGIAPSIFWLRRPDASPDTFAAAARDHIPVFAADASAAANVIGLARAFHRAIQAARPGALVINAAGRPRFWLTCWLARYWNIPVAWMHQMVEHRDPRRLPPRWLGGRMEGPQWWRVPQALRHHLAAAACDAVITYNQADRERVARWHNVRPAAITAIPSGVDCTRFRFDPAARQRLRERWSIADSGGRASRPPLIIGTAARLVGRKGIEPLIEATALLRARGIPAVAVIAGDGPQRPAFSDLAARLGVPDAVRFVGFVEDMPAFHSALDVFALCSETESFGVVLAEAMACERVAVATPTAGATQQIRHLDNGWLLSGFAANELADTLAVLYEALTMREQFGRRGRACVEHAFSIDLTLERTLRAFLPQAVIP